MLKTVFFISMCLLFSGILYATEKLQEKCPDYFHLLSEEHATTVIEYNHAMNEGVAKLSPLGKYMNSEKAFENCLRSVKTTMMDPHSAIDGALEVANCFSIDDFSTFDQNLEVEEHIVAEIKKQLSNILELVKRRLEVVYGASSFEQREAVIACTSYSELW